MLGVATALLTATAPARALHQNLRHAPHATAVIRERLCPLERLKLGEAGLCGLAVPEACDGGGFGFIELAGVMERIGRTTAPIPFFETAVLGGLAIAEFGSAAQKKSSLTDLAAGDAGNRPIICRR